MSKTHAKSSEKLTFLTTLNTKNNQTISSSKGILASFLRSQNMTVVTDCMRWVDTSQLFPTTKTQ